jgi:hypothetical protein
MTGASEMGGLGNRAGCAANASVSLRCRQFAYAALPAVRWRCATGDLVTLALLVVWACCGWFGFALGVFCVYVIED